MKIDLNIRELSTVLAALRLWQESMDDDSIRGRDDLWSIANNCQTCTPLTTGEIDDLCDVMP